MGKTMTYNFMKCQHIIDLHNELFHLLIGCGDRIDEVASLHFLQLFLYRWKDDLRPRMSSQCQVVREGRQ
jgi:hypothetical protein